MASAVSSVDHLSAPLVAQLLDALLRLADTEPEQVEVAVLALLAAWPLDDLPLVGSHLLGLLYYPTDAVSGLAARVLLKLLLEPAAVASVVAEHGVRWLGELLDTEAAPGALALLRMLCDEPEATAAAARCGAVAELAPWLAGSCSSSRQAVLATVELSSSTRGVHFRLQASNHTGR